MIVDTYIHILVFLLVIVDGLLLLFYALGQFLHHTITYIIVKVHFSSVVFVVLVVYHTGEADRVAH